MKVLFYSSQNNGAGEKVQSIVETRVPEKSREIHRTIESLSKWFWHPWRDIPIVVLVAAGTQDLLDLLSIQDSLKDKRIILVLPDRRDETVSLGFKLFPRFMSYVDGNFEDVDAVLSKMLGLVNINNQEVN